MKGLNFIRILVKITSLLILKWNEKSSHKNKFGDLNLIFLKIHIGIGKSLKDVRYVSVDLFNYWLIIRWNYKYVERVRSNLRIIKNYN